jgi:hypothetical protein
MFLLFPYKAMSVNIIYRFNNVIGFVNTDTLWNTETMDIRTTMWKILSNTQEFYSLRLPIQGMTGKP